MFAYSSPISRRAWDDKENLAEGEVFFDHEPSDSELRRAFPDEFKRREASKNIDDARRDFIQKVSKVIDVEIPDGVSAEFVIALLHIGMLSDDEKAKLTEHVNAFQKAKQV